MLKNVRKCLNKFFSISVRNLLIMSSVFSLVGGVALFVFSSLLLDGLRREEETAFKGWLLTMAIFTPWKIVSWAFAGSLNFP